MINQKIINVVLKSASSAAKDIVIYEIFKHIAVEGDYNDKKAAHILEMLADPTSFISNKDVNLDYIKEHLDLIVYNTDNYIIKDIKIICVDNINSYIELEYKYLEKSKEHEANVDFNTSHTSISFINNPEILKDVKS